jgi:threonine/homoserine/homoserine lactone efflux protein
VRPSRSSTGPGARVHPEIEARSTQACRANNDPEVEWSSRQAIVEQAMGLGGLRGAVRRSVTIVSPAFLLTTLVVVATPGTGALFTIVAGLSHGRRQSLVAAFGCTLGVLPHLLAAVTGLAALMHASAVAFSVVKWAGVAYLLYLAVATWRDSSDLAVDQRTPASFRRTIWQAVLVNLLNPKLTIFFVAFLPQFVSPTDPHQLTRMLTLSAVFMLATFVVFATYGVLAAALRDHVISRPKVVQWLRRSFAVCFVAMGAKLAFSRPS